jgi:hypothetical protein
MMAQLDNPLLNVDLITKTDLSESDIAILAAFNREDADAAAHEIDHLCPSLVESQEKARKYLWRLWDLMVTIVESPDATSEIHEHFVNILQCLMQIPKGELKNHNVCNF